MRERMAIEPGRTGERGASLVEVLAAIAIVSIALVVLIAALSTGSFGVRNANRLTRATNLATRQLEAIKAAAYATGASDYPAVPTGACTIQQTIAYWNGSSFTSTPGDDAGMQRVTVTATCGDVNVTVSAYKVDR